MTMGSTATGSRGKLVESGSQTDFNPGDSAVDQRVTFAVAQQQLDDNKKYAQALEVQRLAMERAHQLDLADKSCLFTEGVRGRNRCL